MSLVSEVLFSYQVEAAKRIFEQRRVLLADQPGLGKTLEVLGALELDGLLDYESDILILTPIINAQTTWIDSINRFVVPRSRYGAVNIIDLSKGSAKQKAERIHQWKQSDAPRFYIANHAAIEVGKNGMRVDLTDIVFDAIIIDESHMVLPITGNGYTQFWKGLVKLDRTEDAFKIAISGTPDRGKLENRYGTWSFLYPRETPSNRWAWLNENFWVVETQVSRNRSIRVPQGLKSEVKWRETDAVRMIRRTKAEVLPQLPPKRYVDVSIPLTDEQTNAYYMQQIASSKKMQEAAEGERESGEAIVFAIRARQIATCTWDAAEPVVNGKSAKLEWLLEWLSERGFIEQDAMADNEAKVVIVSQFSKVLHWLKKELENAGVAADVLDGGTSTNERVRIQQEFQTGGLRVVLLSGTMGVGINLDRADDLIMVDSPYDPDRIEQIEDRVHRASNMHHVTIWNLIAKDTIDEAIAEKVSKRYTITRNLMDGSRGVEFERKVLAIVKGEDK